MKLAKKNKAEQNSSKNTTRDELIKRERGFSFSCTVIQQISKCQYLVYLEINVCLKWAQLVCDFN